VQRPCIVPKAVGRTLREARRLVSAGECRVGTVKRLKSTAKAKGRIVRQSPRAGTTLDANAAVGLWLGTGPKKP
jgi:beta-lactam-binding protein with PASTA domain